MAPVGTLVDKCCRGYVTLILVGSLGHKSADGLGVGLCSSVVGLCTRGNICLESQGLRGIYKKTTNI